MKRICGLGPVFLALACAGGAARAEVRQAVPDGFLLAYASPVKGDAKHAWEALVGVSHWWSGEHTWSGKSANLGLAPTADGCFCERWSGGSAAHGRVLMALPERMLRLDTALGPLQEFALNGVLTFWIRTAEDGSTRLELEYRVNGASTSGLDELAPKVDDMLGEQFARLVRWTDHGDPEPPPAPPAPGNADDAALRGRSAILEQWKQSMLEQQAGQRPTPPASGEASKPDAPKRDAAAKERPPRPSSTSEPAGR
ncbi:hypothetical protein [Dokdonella sp.]|uniref:hypothetical protein n=1 Tax=Dokdonella sp. TaxID=2291710 RepID=UPI002F3E2F16